MVCTVQVELEQYPTGAHVASRMIYTVLSLPFYALSLVMSDYFFCVNIYVYSLKEIICCFQMFSWLVHTG
jgi:hypothetical protein